MASFLICKNARWCFIHTLKRQLICDLVVLTVIGQLIANLCGNCGKDKESGEVDVQQEQAEIQEDYQQTTQA